MLALLVQGGFDLAERCVGGGRVAAGAERGLPQRRRRGTAGCDNRRMSFEWVTPGLLGLLAAIVLWIALRPPPAHPDAERQARDLRDEIARSAQGTRQEIVATLGDFQRTLLAQQGDVARTQNELIDSLPPPARGDPAAARRTRSARRPWRRSSRRAWRAKR